MTQPDSNGLTSMSFILNRHNPKRCGQWQLSSLSPAARATAHIRHRIGTGPSMAKGLTASRAGQVAMAFRASIIHRTDPMGCSLAVQTTLEGNPLKGDGAGLVKCGISWWRRGDLNP